MINLTEDERLILNAFVENNMSVSKTAKALYYSRNNMVYHIGKIQNKYGVNLRNFYDLCKLLGYEKVEVDAYGSTEE